MIVVKRLLQNSKALDRKKGWTEVTDFRMVEKIIKNRKLKEKTERISKRKKERKRESRKKSEETKV